jgi:hypothetical protein
MTTNSTRAICCPFYGYAAVGGVFLAQHGNQCPLLSAERSTETERHLSPCEMELNGAPVDWFKCRFSDVANKRSIDALLATSVIFPEGEKDCETLKAWFERRLLHGGPV